MVQKFGLGPCSFFRGANFYQCFIFPSQNRLCEARTRVASIAKIPTLPKRGGTLSITSLKQKTCPLKLIYDLSLYK